MNKEKQAYKAGDTVPDSSEYICEICHTEGGTDGKKLEKGAKFPECMNCGHSTSWTKAKEKE